MVMKINIYVDGFNLYYGSLKDTPYRWLDLLKLSQFLFPKDTINHIKYFTALVKARSHNPDQPIRQQTYLRALKTIPNLTVIEGSFLTKEVIMPLAAPPGSPVKYAKVIKSEEKGSDVNLAVHLLNDGYKKDYELGVVITNDSDLVEPIKIVRYELGLPVGLVNPHKHPSFVLRPHTTFIKRIRKGVLQASQFPKTLTDSLGTFHKPASW